MNKLILLSLLVLLASASTQAPPSSSSTTTSQTATPKTNDPYIAPDLDIDLSEVTCDTADARWKKAQADQDRLVALSLKIPSYIGTFVEVQALVTQVCTLYSGLRTLSTPPTGVSFLERSHNIYHNLVSLIQQASNQTASQDDLDDFVSRQLATIETAVNTVTQAKAKDPTVPGLCAKIQEATAGAIGYLNFLKSYIATQYTDKVLPDRIEQLKTKVEVCKTPVGPPSTNAQILAGSVSRTWPSDHKMAQKDPLQRYEDIRVDFSTPFEGTPQIGLALQGFDIRNNDLGIDISTTPITIQKTYFVIRVFAREGTGLLGIQVAWLATHSTTTGVYIYEDQINKGMCSGSEPCNRPLKVQENVVFGTAYSFISGIKASPKAPAFGAYVGALLKDNQIAVVYTPFMPFSESAIYSTTFAITSPANTYTISMYGSPSFGKGTGTRSSDIMVSVSKFVSLPSSFFALNKFSIPNSATYDVHFSQVAKFEKTWLKFTATAFDQCQIDIYSTFIMLFCTNPKAGCKKN